MKRFLNMTCWLLIILLAFSACTSAPSSEKPSEESNSAVTTVGDETSEESPKYDETITITASNPFFLETGVDYMDDLSKEILKDYNAIIEPVPVSLADLNSQNRIWIASGDMPDIVYAGFTYADYIKFAEQGLIRAMPEDYEERYPNLAKAMDASGYVEPLKEKTDGIIYGAPKPIFINKIVDPFGDHASIYYRKDWAEELGLPVKTAYTIDELMTMAETFMEKDPNGNGAGKTIGFAAEPYAMISAFCLPYDSGFSSIYKKDGEYVFGPFQDGCLQGLKTLRQYYDKGIIYKDFYTIKSRGEVEAMFNAGLTGIMRNGGAFGNVNRLYNAFSDATGLNAMDCIEMANVIGPNGKINSVEMSNLQSISYFNPNMDDQKFERILAILDHVATPEIQNLINMGFEGKDYTKDGEEITITRPLNDNGEFLAMGDVYPSYNLWSLLVIAWDDFTARDPSINSDLIEKNSNLWIERTENGNMLRTDYDLQFYSSKPYDKLITITSNLHNDLTNLVVKSADIESGFNEYVEANTPVVSEGLADINGALG